jgi:hypothetical protein
MGLPKPPIKNMMDFVVFCFISIVVIVLLLLTISLAIVVVFFPDRDISRYAQVLSNVMTTLIGALLGFFARKGFDNSGKEKESEE